MSHNRIPADDPSRTASGLSGRADQRRWLAPQPFDPQDPLAWLIPKFSDNGEVKTPMQPSDEKVYDANTKVNVDRTGGEKHSFDPVADLPPGLIATRVQRGDIVLLATEEPLSDAEMKNIRECFERFGLVGIVAPTGLQVTEVLRPEGFNALDEYERNRKR